VEVSASAAAEIEGADVSAEGGGDLAQDFGDVLVIDAGDVLFVLGAIFAGGLIVDALQPLVGWIGREYFSRGHRCLVCSAHSTFGFAGWSGRSFFEILVRPLGLWAESSEIGVVSQ
jgi:hypothetical protein